MAAMPEALDLMSIRQDIRNLAAGRHLRQTDQDLYDSILNNIPELCLDGSKCTGFLEFCHEFARVWSLDGDVLEDEILWKRAENQPDWRSKALDDAKQLMFGDFGNQGPPYVLVFCNASIARMNLGNADRVKALEGDRAMPALELEEFRKWLETEFKEGDDEDWDFPCDVTLQQMENSVAARDQAILKCKEEGQTTFDIVIELIKELRSHGVFLEIHDGERDSSYPPVDMSELSQDQRDCFVGQQQYVQDIPGYVKTISDALLPLNEIIVDGSKCASKDQFYDEIEKAWNMGSSSWGRNLDALSDIICGGFGMPLKNPPHIIVIRKASEARESLGAELLGTLTDTLSCRKSHGAFLRLED